MLACARTYVREEAHAMNQAIRHTIYALSVIGAVSYVALSAIAAAVDFVWYGLLTNGI